MHHGIMRFFENNDPRVLALIVSLLSSFILGLHFYINVDGILYLNTAKSFLNHSDIIPPLGAKWPFYSWLIATLTQITGFSLQTSALVLQAVFVALLAISFINIVRLLGGNKWVQYLAAAVILLHPDLNENRNTILRDFGYLAFLFTGIYYFFKYFSKPSWYLAFIWTLCMGLAVLFRIEGIVLFLMMPFFMFFQTEKSFAKNLLQTFRLYSFFALLCLFALTIVFWKHHEISASTLGRVAELPQWWQHITHSVFSHWDNMRDEIKNFFPLMKTPHVSIFMLGGFFIYIVYRLITATGVLFFGLSVYGQIKKVFSLPQQYILYGLLSINAIIILVFVSMNWFVAERYLMVFSLVLLLWTPFAIQLIYQKWIKTSYHRQYPWLGKTLVIIIALGLAVESYVSFGPSHAFVNESAEWIQTHTPENATVYSNNVQLAYYANRPGPNWNTTPSVENIDVVLNKKGWEKYDYVAFYINRNDKKLNDKVSTLFDYPPLEEFTNNKGDKILIYKTMSH